MPRVTIVQRILTQYREPFFEELRQCLERKGIELNLVYGQGTEFENSRGDQVQLEWADWIDNTYLLGGLVIQPCYSKIKDSDLVIVEQANKYPLNFLLMAQRSYSCRKLAFWGHGRNFQDDRDSLANKVKLKYSNYVDWWFAYTKSVKADLIDNGFPAEKITAVQNSIDTSEIKHIKNSISLSELSELRENLKLSGSTVGVYCGGMYTEKQIPFLLDACQLIKKQLPNFKMIFMGGGPDSVFVENAASKNDWIHYVGPQFGAAKIKYLLLADIQMLPGAVGLGVIDSFAMGLPLITTRNNNHGPEFSYLESGVNSIVTDFDLECYVSAVVDVLSDQNRMKTLVDGCLICSNEYSIENMTANFAGGIVQCLGVS